MIVLLDADGPLFQWEADVLRRITEAGVVPPIALADRRGWSLSDQYAEEHRAHLYELMETPGLYLNLPVVDGAVDAYHEMVGAGLDVRVCSSPTLYNPTCASDKYVAIERHFGRDLAERTILTRDKTLVRGAVLVDDKESVTGAARPEWTHVIFDLPHNADAVGPRLTDWSQWRAQLGPHLVNAAVSSGAHRMYYVPGRLNSCSCDRYEGEVIGDYDKARRAHREHVAATMGVTA